LDAFHHEHVGGWNTSMMVGVFLSCGLLPRISRELRRAEIHGEGRTPFGR
jgi:hypothetical protein